MLEQDSALLDVNIVRVLRDYSHSFLSPEDATFRRNKLPCFTPFACVSQRVCLRKENAIRATGLELNAF
jgi:hypothetical protein